MTNPLKGEVTFEARGQTFTFQLGINAQIMIENKVGMPLAKFFANKDDDQFKTQDVRTVFHAGLYRHHKMTEEEVGDLIDEIGQQRVAEIFIEAAAAAFTKDPASSRANGNGADPQKATRERTGMNS